MKIKFLKKIILKEIKLFVISKRFMAKGIFILATTTTTIKRTSFY